MAMSFAESRLIFRAIEADMWEDEDTGGVDIMDLDGKEMVLEADSLLAICLQHEIDHLNGTIILDHASRLKRSLYEKKVEKWQKQRTDSA